jgi:predicted RNA binding protein YcfA (HicA-like mRNA interferase family)
MRIPRDISGKQLARLLEKYGYRITRQTGSHMRLVTQEGGGHHITIPSHNDLRVGTLNAICTDVADHLGIDRNDLIESLFRK